MKSFKVSIILPVYNVEKYLSACLDSLLAQTLEEIEIVAVNDGSTDGSLQILQAYQLSLIHISEPTRRVVISYAVFCLKKFFLMIRRPPRSTRVRSSAASDVYKRQAYCFSQLKQGTYLIWLNF